MTTPANLIFIQSDNHNRAVTGCYGHAVVKTPTLDKLAARGARFANSYSTSALCCPARAAMACGLEFARSHSMDLVVIWRSYSW